MIAVLRVITPLAPVLVGLSISICTKYDANTPTCSDDIAARDTHEVVANIQSLQQLSKLVIIATLPLSVVGAILSLPSLASLCLGHVLDTDVDTSPERTAKRIQTVRRTKRFSRSIDVDTFGTHWQDIRHSNLRSLTMFDIIPPLLRSIFKLSCYSIIHLELTSNGNQAQLVDLWWLDSICLLRALHSLTIVNANIGDLQLQSLLRSKASSVSSSILVLCCGKMTIPSA